jgi:hypothetical protein
MLVMFRQLSPSLYVVCHSIGAFRCHAHWRIWSPIHSFIGIAAVLVGLVFGDIGILVIFIV